MEISSKIIENIFRDFAKHDITHKERAELIQIYLDDNKLSQREFGKQFGISHSTIADWLLWNRTDSEQHEELKQHGFNDTEIYRTLRNNKKTQVDRIVYGDFEKDVAHVIVKLEKYINWKHHDASSLPPIEELRQLILKIENRVKFVIELREKNGFKR